MMRGIRPDQIYALFGSAGLIGILLAGASATTAGIYLVTLFLWYLIMQPWVR